MYRKSARTSSPSSLIQKRDIYAPEKTAGDIRGWRERGNKQQYIDGKGPTGEELVGKPPSGRYYLVGETRP